MPNRNALAKSIPMSIPKFRVSRRLLTLSLLAMAGLLSGCHQSVQAGSAISVLPEVQLATVRAERPQVHLSLPGELQPFQDTGIQAHEMGFADKLYVDRGSDVRAGQVLATIDAPDLVARAAAAEQRLSAARARTLQAEANLRRDQGTLLGLRNAEREMQGAVAENDINIAAQNVSADQSEVASRQAVENAAARDLKAVRSLEAYLRVTAPFAGRIISRGVSPGDLVGPTKTPLFRLQQIDRLRLVVDVPEAESAGVQAGQVVPFTVSAHPDQQFTGVVRRISDSLRPNTRTMPVELDVDNRSLTLDPGMYAQVDWRFQRPRPTLFVPSSAVVNSSRETFVEVLRGGKIDWVPVQSGLATGPETEVFGQLGAGDQVVLQGSEELRPGSTVKISAHKKGASQQQSS